MSRKVLLLEPNYKNKYPPMGLMKLSTYFRRRGDDVRFFKGDMGVLAADLLFEEFWKEAGKPEYGEFASRMRQYIKYGKKHNLEQTLPASILKLLAIARKRFKDGDYPKFDIICITTLFTFYWKETIETIEKAKKFLAENGKIIIGGISSTLLHEDVFKETGIRPYLNDRGGSLLDRPFQIDDDGEDIIDELPLDYSLLDETDYKYPASEAFYGYATRGCINHCDFCAVPRLEPVFCGYKSLKNQIIQSAKRFGERKNLLLLDNNAFASRQFNAIIDEIKELGFKKGSLYHSPNEYEIAINNLRDNYNTRTYIKKVIAIYDQLAELLAREDQGQFYIEREKRFLLYSETATVDAILNFDFKVAPLYDKFIYSKTRSGKGCLRSVDFNQGLDARLATEEKIKKLSEINIVPLRIAFDYWDTDPRHPEYGPMREVYEKAIKLAAQYGIRDLSNYVLYNTDNDTPEELYERLALNVNLSDELEIRIYSFPMKYHPVDNPQFSKNRNFIGAHWNKKYIRAIQAILNSTHGKIGKGKHFFEAAFGKDLESFKEILIMPETFIVERYKYDSAAYELYLSQGGKKNPAYTDKVMAKYGGMTAKWREAYSLLSTNQQYKLLEIVKNNIFTQDTLAALDEASRKVLQFYFIKRQDKTSKYSENYEL